MHAQVLLKKLVRLAAAPFHYRIEESSPEWRFSFKNGCVGMCDFDRGHDASSKGLGMSLPWPTDTNFVTSHADKFHASVKNTLVAC